MTTTERFAERVMTPLCRWDYIKVMPEDVRKTTIGANPQPLPEDKWAQEFHCLIPKQLTDPNDVKAFDALKQLVLRAAAAFYPGVDVNGRKPDGSPIIKLPFQDGDAYNQGAGGKKPQYVGMVYFSVRSIGKKHHIKPAQLDSSGAIVDILDKRELYSGCWGKVMVSIYPNMKGAAQGLNFGLSSMLKMKDDTPLFSGGAGNAAEDFKEVAADPNNRPSNAGMFTQTPSTGGLNLGF